MWEICQDWIENNTWDATHGWMKFVWIWQRAAVKCFVHTWMSDKDVVSKWNPGNGKVTGCNTSAGDSSWTLPFCDSCYKQAVDTSEISLMEGMQWSTLQTFCLLFVLGNPSEEMQTMPTWVTEGSAVAGTTYLGVGFVASPIAIL